MVRYVAFVALIILSQGSFLVHSEICSCKYSAFSAVATSVQVANSGDVVAFDEMITNVGDDFDLQTNIFTCRIKGLYAFSFSVRKGGDTTRPDIELQKNGQRVVSVYLLNAEDADQNSNTVVLELNANDNVKLVVIPYGGASQGRIYNDDRRYTTFTGYLLYRDE